jgi:hypothetical protein
MQPTSEKRKTIKMKEKKDVNKLLTIKVVTQGSHRISKDAAQREKEGG